ncbi:hypothetical protein [Bacillus marinisedimentorum]|uniref:hypothetical protein n=1 Tax=Bacillus marinisedimentorum TaxID=1821260 RepID=UPI001B805E51|nr:hypothetical protein [Bacillus marinisedimentorum]
MMHMIVDYQSLKTIYENNLTVRHIAEDLDVRDIEEDAVKVKELLETRGFDSIGIRQGSRLIGYVEVEELAEGACRHFMKSFHSTELITNSTPLIEIFELLQEKRRLFVLTKNEVSGIVTFADLQKPPIRMLLFGIISLLEMHMLELIRKFHPNGGWKGLITEKRLRDAEKLYAQQKERNEEMDLLDNLQLSDKREILLDTQEIIEQLQLQSKTQGEKLFKQIEKLRNNLAHARDITNGTSWSEVIPLVKQVEGLIRKSEKIVL